MEGTTEQQDGYNYGKSAYVSYVKSLAEIAKNNGLAIGLKNGVEMLSDVQNVVQYAMNEQVSMPQSRRRIIAKSALVNLVPRLQRVWKICGIQ